MPTPREIQQLVEKLYQIVHQLTIKIDDAKQTAAYASTLGIDVGREADHELFVYEERLAYTLMMLDTVYWVRGDKKPGRHIKQVREIMQQHYKLIDNNTDDPF